jgi:hypothetical protein
MLSGSNVQDDVLAKEAAKIAYKRQILEQRKLRIHNAKQRTIGLDIDALDAQVAEKQRNKARDQDILNFESERSCPSLLLIITLSITFLSQEPKP